MKKESGYYVPYFLKKSEWYYVDESNPNCRYSLTEKAPLRARKSYEAYLKEREKSTTDSLETDSDGITWVENI